MLEDDFFEKNLNNIHTDMTLFGEEVPRLSVMERVGFAPISIWKPDWTITKELKDWVGDAGQTRELQGRKMALLGSKYTTSIFNPHLAQMILSAYATENSLIYDPFGGGGTRGFIAVRMGHTYRGVEIRPEEVQRILERQKELEIYFDIFCADACEYDAGEETFDFAYTCPPYFDLEVYSPLDGDISNVGDYDVFLDLLKRACQHVYRCLKPDSFFIMVVGNFRDKHGALRHFSGDSVRICKELGFILHDELIFWGASGQAYQRLGQYVANRKSVRVHESILVFKKP